MKTLLISRWTMIAIGAVVFCGLAAVPVLAKTPGSFLETTIWQSCERAGFWHLQCQKFEIANPYANLKKNIYKGNTHSHTTGSTDGRNTPAEVMAFFKKAGYDFNAISDHEAVTPDPGVSGILFVPGTEDGLGLTGRDHMIKLGPAATATVLTDDQASIDTALAEDDYIQINHPDGATDWPLEKIVSTIGQNSISIWNGQRALEYASQIDAALNAGRRLNIVVEEDLHDTSAATSGLQAVHVYANTLSVKNVVASLKSGDYYSTYTPAGQTEQAITVKQIGNKIIVTSNQRSTFDWYGKGSLLKTDTGVRSAVYTIVGDEKYVRVRVTGGTAVAWTNPIFIEPVERVHR